MKLSSLLDERAELLGSGDVEVGELCFDTRKIKRGDLYAAISGTHADGHLFIPEALAKGAAALLGTAAARPYAVAVPVVVDANPRLRLTKMAARMHPGQPERIVAVTGTNGKTSVASFVRQIWDGLGIRGASLGTLGVEGRGRWPQTQLTTPDPVLLHRLCAQLARSGVQHLALEASSHGLDQFRLDQLRLAAGAFTNISRDHFDYHGSYEAYLAAKKRLMGELLAPGTMAVLNADVPEFEELATTARSRDLEVVDYGASAERYRIVAIEPHAGGQVISFEIDGRGHKVETRLVGRFQASNMLAALGLAVASGVELERALPILGMLKPAPGRMQLVTRHPNGAPAFVDYAHTPDALEKALMAFRPHTTGLLHVVVGCGGDRDPGKRPLNG